MVKHKLYTAIMLSSAMALSGCGSDSDNTVVTTEVSTVDDSTTTDTTETIVEKQHEALEVAVVPNTQLDGTVNFYIGRWHPCTTDHPEMCTDDMPDDYEIPTTGPYTGGTYGRAAEDGSYHKLYNGLTSDDSKYVITVDTAEVKKFAADSVRNDIFVTGHYSVLDIALYVSSIRDDFEVTLGEFNDELNTYEFTTSFDANGDGDFTDADLGDYQNSENWYTSILYSGGVAKKSGGNPSLEPIYERIDETLVKTGMHIRFQPESATMTERRNQGFKDQVDRIAANDGKVVLPELRANFGDGQGVQVLATNIEVTAHNLRPDIFQPGVITAIDAMLSAHDEYGVEFSIGFWPTVSTQADVGSYAVHGVAGKRAYGFYGYALQMGEDFTYNDVFRGLEYPSAQEVIDGIGTWANICSFLRDDNGDLTLETAQECIDNWYNTFGGKTVHRMLDITPMMAPVEYIRFNWYGGMVDGWEMSQYNDTTDGNYPIYDIEQATETLEDTHFGWGYADCGLCHSLTNIHDEGDIGTLGVTNDAGELIVAPYECAQCHGSNGAPEGHGEESRCFWCHSNDKMPQNHGEASTAYFFDDVTCQGETTQRSISVEGESGPCADVVKAKSPTSHKEIHDIADNSTTYSEVPKSDRITRGNSDWKTSQSFPDPYACVTCHPNK